MASVGKRIIIAGGGIGGLTLANFLHRMGHSVRLFEKKRHISAGGASFTISPNGQRVLNMLGFSEEARRFIHPLSSMIVREGSGKGILNSSLSRVEDATGYSIGGCNNWDILKLLYGKLPPGVVSFNRSFYSLERDSKGLLKVEMEDGEVLEADIVVGADGVMSTVSKFVIRGDTSPTFAEHEAYYGYFEEDRQDAERVVTEESFPKNAVTQIFEKGSFFGTFPCGGLGESSTKSRAWVLISPTPFESFKASSSRKLPGDAEELVDSLKEKTSMFSPDVLEAILSSSPGQIRRSNLYYRLPYHKWFRENVVLLGDAVHSPLPYTGQGANLAMEDAYTLALAISRNASNNYLAFKEYQDARMERCTRIVRLGELLGRMDVAENNTAHKLRTLLRPHDRHSNDAGHMHPSIPLLKMLESEFVDDKVVPGKTCIRFVN